MSPTTLSGAVKIGMWSTSMRRMSACMRDAVNSCVLGCIIRSCFATRYQDGTLFHSGRGAFDTGDVDGTLHRGKKGVLFGRSVLRECRRNPRIRHPDEAMRVPGELRCLRMRGLAVEDFRHGVPFAGRQSRYEHQSAYAIVPGRADHRAGVGVGCQDDGVTGSLRARPIGSGSVNHHNRRFPICRVHNIRLF